jgi:hypothetical protein
MAFIFDAAAAAISAGTFDFTSGVYYAHLVTAPPAPASSTVAGLTLPTDAAYALATLTGLSDNAVRWTFAPFGFAAAVYVVPPIGVVICRRLGAAPASTDQPICYSALSDLAGMPIAAVPGNYSISIDFGPDGAILK